METLFYALLTVSAWGLWLAPSQNVVYSSQRVRTFYVALANLGFAVLVGAFVGLETLDWQTSLFAGAGGLVWALSGFFAFYACNQLGLARGPGIWSPLNVVVSFAWGILLFGEMRDASLAIWIIITGAVLVALFGIRLILFASAGADKSKPARKELPGIAAAVGAGILWGSYFIPLQLAEVSIWVSVLPLSIGIFAGSCVGVLIGRDPLKLSSPADYGGSLVSGLLWGLGNYGSLKLMELIGTGKGFTVAQLCLVVNALLGIYWFRQPKPGTRAARMALTGILLALTGGIIIGAVRYL